MKDEAKVKLIDYTENALDKLIYLRKKRIGEVNNIDEIYAMDYDEQIEILKEMFDTIKGDFEFVDYTFEINNCSRSFTHQNVRTRPNSYSQQSMRVVDASEADYLKASKHPAFSKAINYSKLFYAQMIDEGVPIQDAREVLSTGIFTSITEKINLRSLSDMASLRLCKRTSGEYQNIFKKMVAKVLEVHPWAEPLLQCYCVRTGICYFPRYTKCPVQPHTMPISQNFKDDIKEQWEKHQHEANPSKRNI